MNDEHRLISRYASRLTNYYQSNSRTDDDTFNNDTQSSSYLPGYNLQMSLNSSKTQNVT